MEIHFHKYQGTGNDFIMIDDRQESFPKSDTQLITKLCERKKGIGADGVILLQSHPDLDFRMRYFNPDGSQSLCGNGSRCAMAFAASLGIIAESTVFETTDGVHDGFFKNGNWHFRLHDVNSIETIDGSWFINTGSPHHIQLVENLDDFDVIGEGRAIRNSPRYSPNGTNVNFVKKETTGIQVRTYERGVENETLSCGTGVTACALAVGSANYESPVHITTLGGELEVSFKKTGSSIFTEVYLAGPALKVYEGSIDIA